MKKEHTHARLEEERTHHLFSLCVLLWLLKFSASHLSNENIKTTKRTNKNNYNTITNTTPQYLGMATLSDFIIAEDTTTTTTTSNDYDDEHLLLRLFNTATVTRYLQDNDDGVIINEPDGFGGGNAGGSRFIDPVYIIIGLFFLLWNGTIGASVTMALSHLFRGKCDSQLIILLCPHWIIGFIIPVSIGYGGLGIKGALILGFVDIIMPYSFWILYHNIWNEEVVANSCCSCFFLNNNNNNEDNNEEEVVVDTIMTTSLEVPTGSADTNKTTKNDILIVKKVVTASDQKGNNDMVEKDDTKSFRFNHPKSDLVLPAVRNNNNNNNNNTPSQQQTSSTTNTTTTSSSTNSNSVLLCAICLENYKVGEDIGWSKNPLCHHVFHKDCILEVLKGVHKLCPICRNSYYYQQHDE